MIYVSKNMQSIEPLLHTMRNMLLQFLSKFYRVLRSKPLNTGDTHTVILLIKAIKYAVQCLRITLSVSGFKMTVTRNKLPLLQNHDIVELSDRALIPFRDS